MYTSLCSYILPVSSTLKANRDIYTVAKVLQLIVGLTAAVSILVHIRNDTVGTAPGRRREELNLRLGQARARVVRVAVELVVLDEAILGRRQALDNLRQRVLADDVRLASDRVDSGTTKRAAVARALDDAVVRVVVLAVELDRAAHTRAAVRAGVAGGRAGGGARDEAGEDGVDDGPVVVVRPRLQACVSRVGDADP